MVYLNISALIKNVNLGIRYIAKQIGNINRSEIEPIPNQTYNHLSETEVINNVVDCENVPNIENKSKIKMPNITKRSS